MTSLAQAVDFIRIARMRQLIRPVLVIVAAAAFLAACRGPTLTQRIERDRDAFESWPAEVQDAVSQGRVEVGFTPEQVRMAWGEPDHVAMEVSAEEETERWVYEKSSPSIGIGIGGGNFGRGGGVGGSVGTTVGGNTNVIAVARFRNGEVFSFDRASD